MSCVVSSIVIAVACEQGLDQSPVRRNRLAQSLGVDPAFFIGLGDAAGLPVTLGDLSVAYGQIISPSIEVGLHWVAAGGHDVCHQCVCVAHRTARVVDKLSLHVCPTPLEVGALSR